MSFLMHEELQRGNAALQRLTEARVIVCGAGALGANLTEGLARSGCSRLEVIDFDRVEERNLSTQPYQRSDIGSPKAQVLAHMLYRAVGADVEPRITRLTERNARKLLRGADLVIDTFDNSVSRRVVAETCDSGRLPCLHAGLAPAYGEALWNEGYKVPSDTWDDVCDYPLARNLALLTATVACECALAFLLDGEQRAYTVTLSDLKVQPYVE